jgi:tRNA-dihydrouridine synthase 3
MERKNKLKEMIIGANYVLDCPLTIKIRNGVKDKMPIAHKLISQLQEWGGNVSNG